MTPLEPPRSAPRRRLRVVALCVLLATAGAAVALAGQHLVRDRSRPDAPTASAGPAQTAEVVRGNLVESVTVKGRIDYGTPVPVAVSATGIVTWLPPVGAPVERGQALLRIDEQPVVLLYGEIPMYRALTVGVQGPDVLQFERNMAALGYEGFTVDETYSRETAAAVKRWQRWMHRPVTGLVQPGQVVYAGGPIRIAERLARLGAANTSDAVSYTSPAKRAVVDAKADQVSWATKGRKVQVSLPNGTTVSGTVTGVDASATESATGAQAAVPAVPAATVAVTVTIADQKKIRHYERGPVDVRYVDRERRGVLTVPVSALLALAEGGYGVEVVEGRTTSIVAVEVGMFTDARVEVRSRQLRPGVTVTVTS